MSTEEPGQDSKGYNFGLIAFIPFGTLWVHLFYMSIPLRWVSLASLLKSVSLFSIYTNVTRNDILWSIFGLWAFLTVSMPIYLITVKSPEPRRFDKHPEKISFANLFKTCSNSVYSDYRTALLAKIPLVIHTLRNTHTSILYEIFGIDWVMHALAGFGIGIAAMKAYKTAVNHYGYSNLTSYFRLDGLRVFRNKRKTGSLEFAIFGIVVAALIWELVERVVWFLSPINVLRIGAESSLNSFGDIIFDIIGGIVAWALINSKLKWF